MGIRMNSVMNGITNSDGEYQAIIRKSDEYSDRLDEMDLSKEVRLLIDRYVSEQNALGSRYGMLAYLLGFSDCKEMLLEKCLFAESKSNDFQRVIYMKKPRNRACLQQALFSSSDIVIPTQLLSSLNRSNSNALWHILPHFSPFCEGLHYSTTDLPWQTNNIFIIWIYPFISL